MTRGSSDKLVEDTKYFEPPAVVRWIPEHDCGRAHVLEDDVRRVFYLITYGSRPRKRARLMAFASSRCFFADTAVMRLGTILPRSEM